MPETNRTPYFSAPITQAALERRPNLNFPADELPPLYVGEAVEFAAGETDGYLSQASATVAKRVQDHHKPLVSINGIVARRNSIEFFNALWRSLNFHISACLFHFVKKLRLGERASRPRS
jgi:hypothetical protein